MTVLVIQHVPCESPGLIAETLQANEVSLDCVRVFQGDAIPRRMGRYAGLVIMGGPMSVFEQDQYPFLSEEIRLLEVALSEQRPILGICLGSQLLAAALGSPVTRGTRKEIGWHPVTLGRAASDDALLHGLPESFSTFHWHGDVFPVPHGAARLAWSAWTECQAFRFGASAYGFLFHLELTERIVCRMTRAFREELWAAGMNEQRVLEPLSVHLPPLQKTGRRVFQRWAQLVRDGESSPQAERQNQVQRETELAAGGAEA